MNVQDIKWEEIQVLNPVTRPGGSWSMTINYEGRKLQISTPIMACTFPVSCFKTNRGQNKYSMTLTLNETTDGVKEFKKFIEDVNNNVKEIAKPYLDGDETFHNCIYYNKDKPQYDPYLKIKLVGNSKVFKFQAFKNGSPFEPTIDGLTKGKYKITRGTKVQCVLQLNPIYRYCNYPEPSYVREREKNQASSSGYGVSYQLKSINIIKDEFAVNPTTNRITMSKSDTNKVNTKSMRPQSIRDPNKSGTINNEQEEQKEEPGAQPKEKKEGTTEPMERMEPMESINSTSYKDDSWCNSNW